MAFSQAQDFSITDASFNEVHGDYNHSESSSNLQIMYLGSPNSPLPISSQHSQQHIPVGLDSTKPHSRVISTPVAAYGSNVGGNQINNVYNYILAPGTYPPRLPTAPADNAPQLSKNVDISIVLDNAVKLRRENLDWRQSIVDLMKVLGLDPTEETRSRLALGVGYEGNRAELTAMNIWLLSYVKEVVASVGGDLAVARNVLLKKISNQSIDVTNRLTLTPDVYRSHPPHLLTADVQLPSKNIDISIVLDNAVKLRRENLNWRQSIVDIMKVLRLDSSREPRTRLALAVGYDGDVNDSWTMNIWLLSYVKDVIAAVGGNLTAAREVLLAKMS